MAKSSECYLLNLLPPVRLLITVLRSLIGSLTIFKLIFAWFQMAVVWLHMLLHMFQANFHLQIHGYLSSLKLLESDKFFLVCLLLLVVSSPISNFWIALDLFVNFEANSLIFPNYPICCEVELSFHINPVLYQSSLLLLNWSLKSWMAILSSLAISRQI